MEVVGAVCVLVYVTTSAVLFHRYVTLPFEACAWLSRGGVLVDVDSTNEFRRHHPRVALSIPLEDLLSHLREVGVEDRPVVVFAHRWRRGAQAARFLRRVGFQNVLNVAGLRTRETPQAGDYEKGLVELAPAAPAS